MKTATFSCSLEDLVLAWLATRRTKPDRKSLVEAVAPMFGGDQTAAKKHIGDALQQLNTDGYMDQKRPREQLKPPLRLTEAGRRAAFKFLEFENLPPKADWKWVKKVVWLKSVGLKVTPALLTKAGEAKWRAACMLVLAHGIPLRENVTLIGVLDELFWRALTRKTPLAPQGADVAEASPRVVAPMPTPSTEERQIPKITEPELPKPPVDLETFARRVNEAALAAPTGRWLNDKVFISHVYEELKRRHQTEGRTPEEFKRQLIRAHQARLVRLNRADFVGTLPQGDVLSSKTGDGEHTFHFVRIDHLGQVDVSGARGAGRPR